MKNYNSHSLTMMYYDLSEDMKEYPDAWCYVVVGGRHTGKTYGALKHYYETKSKFMFIKRTIEDVKMITSKGQKAGMNVDIAPFKSINNDLGCNIEAFPIQNGLGGFYPALDGEIAGSIVGYIMALSAGGKYKGSDFSDCDAVIFDEFIPQPWERVGRKEGEQLLDIYGTVARARVIRNKPELKLICLANAVNIYNPTCAALDIIDDISIMANMQKETQSVTMYDDERGIFIRLLPIPEQMKKVEENTKFYNAMHDTQWGAMAWNNEFSYNDFSCVRKIALKGYHPVCKIHYKKSDYFIYTNDELIYMTTSRTNKPIDEYNLNLEKDIRRFYFEKCYDYIAATTDGRMYYKNYTMYDMIFNYKLRFKFT